MPIPDERSARPGAPASAAARTRHARGGRLRRWSPTLSLLGVFGLTVAILSPTAASLAGATSSAAAAAASFNLVVSEAQTAQISTGAGADFVPVERESYAVELAPVSALSVAGELAPYQGGGAPADWMNAAGIAESDRQYVDYIVTRESGWNPNATNPTSGACGLVQALPCSKVPGSGYDPVDNLRWADGYATGRYGSWANAYAFWTSNHWW